MPKNALKTTGTIVTQKEKNQTRLQEKNQMGS